MVLIKKTTINEYTQGRRRFKALMLLFGFFAIASQFILNQLKTAKDTSQDAAALRKARVQHSQRPQNDSLHDVSSSSLAKNRQAPTENEVSTGESQPKTTNAVAAEARNQDESKAPTGTIESRGKSQPPLKMISTESPQSTSSNPTFPESRNQENRTSTFAREARGEFQLQRLNDSRRPLMQTFSTWARQKRKEHRASARLGNDPLRKIPGGNMAALYQNHSSSHCLTESCIEETAKDLARAYPDRTNKKIWCIPNSQQNATLSNATVPNANSTSAKKVGLMLVKVPKSASTTSAAVALRLGHRHDCDLRYIHRQHQRAHVHYASRDRENSFLFMSVRAPGKQIVSHVFWSHVTLQNLQPQNVTAEYLLRRIVNFGTNLGATRHYQGGLQTQFTAMEQIPLGAGWNYTIRDLVNPQHTIARVKNIIDEYDFILVVERMDESLVALALVMGVPVGDVLVTSSKVSAHQDKSLTKQDRLEYVYSFRKKKCLPMVPTSIPPLVDGYLKSDLFRSQSYGDLILHAAANRSLDLTIERLGDRFKEAYKEYMYWKQKEKEYCASRVEFPCSNEGKPQWNVSRINCYDRDLGCGHQCIDEMLAQGDYTPS